MTDQSFTTQRVWQFATATVLFAGVIPGAQAAFDESAFRAAAGLGATDPYRIIFVTSGTHDAVSSDIGTYNTFVSGLAGAAGLPGDYHAVASTAGISAAANISCSAACLGAPVFLVDGTRVADNTAALLNAATTLLLNAVDLDENGAAGPQAQFDYVWTGSNADGGGAGGSELGTEFPVFGGFTATDGFWLSGYTIAQADELPLYGISGDYAVPEPASFSLLAMGGLLLGAARRRWRGLTRGA